MTVKMAAITSKTLTGNDDGNDDEDIVPPIAQSESTDQCLEMLRRIQDMEKRIQDEDNEVKHSDPPQEDAAPGSKDLQALFEIPEDAVQFDSSKSMLGRCALSVFRFGKQGCRLTSFPVPFEAVAKIRMVPLRRIADGEEEEAWYGCNSFSGCMLVNQSRFIAKLTVKECLAGLDGMRVALSDDDKIAMQEAQGSSELMDMILSGEKKPGRKRTQQTTDADEVKLPLQNIFDEHGNVKSTGVAWEDTVKRSEFFSSYFGHAKKGDRSALIFKYLEDIKRALMEKPARKHGFFKLLSEIPKGSRMMNDTA
ncbi:unnamed protein product [Durusdinium trenchii]|uniref:Uncharacterized protein n=2 Tax=Durusdinium trenchii TaxID=1381693 RepID=A0ABP0QHW0_9DINO